MLSRLLEGGDFDFPLKSAGCKVALILIVGVPAVAFAFQVTRIALAARFGSRFDAQDLQRAIALDPYNAGYYHELGLIYAYSFDNTNLRKAVQCLRKATQLNQRKAMYWSDLAEVCDTVNHTACSDLAVERALSMSPATPRFEWKAGNHYLLTGHTEEALEHFRRLLELDGTYAQPVFRVCLRVVGDPVTILQKVLPATRNPQLKLAYLDFLSAQGDIDFANQVWNQISSSDGPECRFSDVRPYLESLISADKMRRAAKVWGQLESAHVIPKPGVGEAGNLVYNGKFSHIPLNAGFDWRSPDAPYVEVNFHDPSAHDGSHCLRVDYAAGRNLESEPVYELVAVDPGRTYRLHAYVRSQDITSDSGPRLRVLDPDCPACLNVSTQTTVGTTSWHALTLDFTAGVRTRVVRLSVWRPRTWTFPMEISGSFWLADVSITALNRTSRETASLH